MRQAYAPEPAVWKTRPESPSFRELGREECEAILARNVVARLAYSFHDRVDIAPIHYVYDSGWLYGRTTPSPKLVPIRHNHWVALEVDEVQGVFDWRSVVVRGCVYFLEDDGPASEREARLHAVELLRRIVPEIGTPADPVAPRSILFRVHADEVTGRAASSRKPEP